ncbi:signal peptidase II [Candidatus Woesearchaeota archaeon]|nr:signal peptidase II [Candidatus Woesearchaeota archaeon]
MKKYFLLIVFVLLFDQLSKFFMQDISLPLFSLFSLQYAENTGAAFSLFQGYNFVLILISLFALIFIFSQFKAHPFSLSLIAGGLLGNLLDRIFLGHVRDFISAGAFPIFNIADSAVTVGVFLLVFVLLREGLCRKLQ